MANFYIYGRHLLSAGVISMICPGSDIGKIKLTTNDNTIDMTWYVMRDLTRPNALRPAHIVLGEEGFRIFTPMVWKIRQRNSKKERVLVPVVHDLLFVKSDRETLDPVVKKIGTLQYRYVKGGGYCEPMTVPENDMDRFIHATTVSDDNRYFMPGEITPQMVGRKVEIVGGPLNGYSGNLLSIKGMRKRRLIVELPGMLSSAVEVSQDFIRFPSKHD